MFRAPDRVEASSILHAQSRFATVLSPWLKRPEKFPIDVNQGVN
jgi:hypothetical protein